MENHEEQEFPVQHLIDTDPALASLIKDLEELDISPKEQAAILFDRVSEMYNLPKEPADINFDDEENVAPHSVYELLGIIKYLHPEEDPRWQVILAVYCVKNDKGFESKEILDVEFEDRHHEVTGLGFLGDGSDVEPLIVTKAHGWVELGCKMLMKLN